MSDLAEIKKSVDDLKDVVITHIAKTEVYRETQSNLVKEHSAVLWDKGENKGLVTKVDRLETSEKLRNWILGSTFITVLGILLTYLFK